MERKPPKPPTIGSIDPDTLVCLESGEDWQPMRAAPRRIRLWHGLSALGMVVGFYLVWRDVPNLSTSGLVFLAASIVFYAIVETVARWFKD